MPPPQSIVNFLPAKVAIAGPGPTLSHIDVGVRDLRNDTARVVDALRTGERVTLTVRGEPIADIVPHGSPGGFREHRSVSSWCDVPRTPVSESVMTAWARLVI